MGLTEKSQCDIIPVDRDIRLHTSYVSLIITRLFRLVNTFFFDPHTLAIKSVLRVNVTGA